MFTHKENKNSNVIVYVDDILITGENQIIETIIKQLKLECELKDLGDVGHYLGMEIKKIDKGYILNQKLKILKLARKFNLENAKPVGSPMDPSFYKLEDDENVLPNNTKF